MAAGCRKTNEIKSEDSAASPNTWTLRVPMNTWINLQLTLIEMWFSNGRCQILDCVSVWPVTQEPRSCAPDRVLMLNMVLTVKVIFCNSEHQDQKYEKNTFISFYVYPLILRVKWNQLSDRIVNRSDLPKHRYNHIWHPNKTEFWHFCKILQK